MQYQVKLIIIILHRSHCVGEAENSTKRQRKKTEEEDDDDNRPPDLIEIGNVFEARPHEPMKKILI